jgi:hypothetical protein
MISDKEIWDILVLTETQGGDKSKAWKINLIFEEIVKRHDK